MAVKRFDWALWAKILALALVLAAGLSLLRPILRIAGTYPDREMELTAQAIDRALVQCFALEGAYPSDIDYLVENYGLMLDRERYVYILDNGLGGDYMGNFRPRVQIIPREKAVEP